MSIKNILISTLFICQLGTQNFIQAELIHGVDVPILDGSKIVGKWFQLTSVTEKDLFACTTNIVERLSDQYTMNVTRILTPEAKKNISNMPKSLLEFTSSFTLRNDSAIIVSRIGDTIRWLSVVFDFDYDSHLVMYVTSSKEDITSSTDGQIFIFCRGKELPFGIIPRIEQSNFYKQGVRANFRLHRANTYGCIE